MKQTVAVIGAGVAGLSVAYELLERSERSSHGIEVVCLEASGRAGGSIRSTREQGFLCDWAANGFLDGAPATVTLIRRLGLEDRLLPADAAAARRYVLRQGRLRVIPTGPAAFLRSDVLSPLGRLRVLCEPLVPRRRRGGEESVYDFAARRIGRQAAEVLADAMAGGIFAGDVKQLSIDASFPRVRAMEAGHGSLFRGMLARRAKSAEEEADGTERPGGRLTSFKDGMQELTDALAGALGPRLLLGRPVARLSDLGRRGVRVHPAEGAPFDVDAAILACPAPAAAASVADMDPEMSSALAAIASVPLAAVHLGFRKDAIPQADGFGFLVPRGQGRRILGTLWASNIFSGRAPERSLLATVMIGGAHDPRAVELDDNKLLSLACADLRAIAGIETRPYFVRVLRHRLGIPQYNLGHRARIDTLERRLAEHPGLWVCGNSYRGISVNACIEQAMPVAEAVLDHLSKRAHGAASGRHLPG